MYSLFQCKEQKFQILNGKYIFLIIYHEMVQRGGNIDNSHFEKLAISISNQYFEKSAIRIPVWQNWRLARAI